MQDLDTNITLSDESVAPIIAAASQGADFMQKAFQHMVVLGADKLAPYLQQTRDGSMKLVRGMKQKYRIALELKLLERVNLSKSYLTPASTLAAMVCEGSMSAAFEHIWDNFLETGDDLPGSVVSGPLYAPSRLNALWGKLAQKKGETPVEVTADGLMVEFDGKQRPWHTLTIAELGAANKGASSAPKVADIIKDLFGDPENLDKKKGKLLKLVEDIEEKNQTLESEALDGVCHTIRAFIEEQRDEVAITLAEAEVESAARRKMELEAKRVDRLLERKSPDSSSIEETPDRKRKGKASDAAKAAE